MPRIEPAARVAEDAQHEGLAPRAAAGRIEDRICATCVTGKCKTCPVDTLIDRLNTKEAW